MRNAAPALPGGECVGALIEMGGFDTAKQGGTADVMSVLEYVRYLGRAFFYWTYALAASANGRRKQYWNERE